MQRIVCLLLAGWCVCLVGCRAFGTGEAGSIRAAGPLASWNFGQRRESQDRVLSLARLMERRGRLDEAAKLYGGVLESHPEDRTACHRLGCLAVRRGELDQGVEYFQRAASNGEVSAALLNDLGYVQYLKHDLPAAEEKLREALRLDPQFKSARNNLGLVLAEQGKVEDALTEFRAAGDEASAHCNLAFIQTKLGQLNEAEANYHRALERNPQQRQAAQALIQFSQMAQKVEAQVANQTSEPEPLATNDSSDQPKRDPTSQPFADVLTVVDRKSVPSNPTPVHSVESAPQSTRPTPPRAVAESTGVVRIRSVLPAE